jgi:hypothetical protein
MRYDDTKVLIGSMVLVVAVSLVGCGGSSALVASEDAGTDASLVDTAPGGDDAALGADDAAPDLVTGSAVGHYLSDTGEVFQPRTYGKRGVAALVPTDDGSFAEHRGAVQGDGAFSIAGVPAGPYYLVTTTSDDPIDAVPVLVSTSSRMVDLSWFALGRPDIVWPSLETLLELDVTGLTPWEDTDQIAVWSLSTGWGSSLIGMALAHLPFPGDTSLDDLQTSWYKPLLEAASDRASLLQLRQRSASDIGYTVIASRSELEPFTVRDGHSVAVSATFAAVPQTETLPITFRASSFEALRTALNPEAPAGSASLALVAGPLGSKDGHVGTPPELVRIEVPAPTRDINLTATYGDPFPESWRRYVNLSYRFPVPYQIAARVKCSVSAEYRQLTPLDEDTGVSLLEPVIGPVRALSLNDADGFQPLVGFPGALTVSWQPPDRGTASFYVVTLRACWQRPGSTRCSFLESAVAYTADTSIVLPRDFFNAYIAYVVAVEAVDEPGTDVTRAPFLRSLPSASTAVVSGMIRR